MIRVRTTLVTLIVVDVVLAFAAARMAWWLGDPQIARAIQHLAPMPIPLAQAITTSALMPRCLVLLAATIAVAWIMLGGVLPQPLLRSSSVFGSRESG